MKFTAKMLVILGLGGSLYGGFLAWLVLNGTREPQQIALEELGKKDGTNNVHLSISSFVFGDRYVGERNDEGRWSRVWIPLLTRDEKWTPRPVVAWSNGVSNDIELDVLRTRRELTGVVSNGMVSLGHQQERFAQLYPGVDLSHAIAFGIDGRFPSPWIAFPLTAVGVVCLAFGVRHLFGPTRKPAVSPASDGI